MSQASFMTQLIEHMSEEESRIWELLQNHQGKERAITNAEIARRTETPVRLTRWCLKSLTEDHRKPIGSLPGKGVFLVSTANERQEVVAFYRSHALSLLKRGCILSHYGTAFLLGQVKLDLDQLEQSLETAS